MNKKEIKRVIEIFLNTDIELTKYSPAIVKHPFFSSGIVYCNDRMVNILEDKEGLEEYKNQIRKIAKDFDSALLLLGKQYRLSFIMYCNELKGLTNEETIKKLIENWSSFESINNDVNISKDKVLNLLLSENNYSLLSKANKEFYDKLPNEMMIYRGVYKKLINGFSWTYSKAVATKFANRYNLNSEKDGKVYCAVINKKDILFVENEIDEEEIVVNYKKLKNVKILEN